MEGTIEVATSSYRAVGEGHWRVDQPDGKAVEQFEFESRHSHLNIYELQRFDLKKAYTISSHNETVCKNTTLTGAMPLVWSWLTTATYVGKKTVHHTEYDLWSATVAGVKLEVAVMDSDPSFLAFFGRKSSTEDVSVIVHKWSVNKPESQWFDVPKECSH